MSVGPGTAALPSISFAADPNTGLYNRNPDEIGFSTAGVNRWVINSAGHLLPQLDNTYDIGVPGFAYPRNLQIGGQASLPTINTAVLAPSSNVIEQRVGTSPQTLRLYQTYTDASNYVRGEMSWSSTIWLIRAQNAGTGGAAFLRFDGNEINFQTAGVFRWTIIGAGHLRADTDNAYDIGISAVASRPRTIYAGTSVVSPQFVPTTKQTVSGSRGANAALASLLTALAGYGLVTDSSTA